MPGLCTENLLRRHFKRRGPEARLYMACIAGAVFPIGMFTYAWSSFPQVHWIVLLIGMVVCRFEFLFGLAHGLSLRISQIFIWASSTIYLAVFTYLADW